MAPAAAGQAAGIRYVSSAGVVAVYADSQIARPMRGSGYVSTPGPGRDPLLATSWLSSKWAGRAPAGHTVLRGFFGGAFDEATLTHSDNELVDLAHGTWVRRFGVSGAPALTRVVRWTRASPQHDVGHAARVRSIEDALAVLPPVAVCGSGFRAIGIPDVISDARAAMDRLLRALARRLEFTAHDRPATPPHLCCPALQRVRLPRLRLLTRVELVQYSGIRRAATTALRTADDVARLPALTPELQQLLTKIREADKGQLAISEEDGRFLRLMVVLNRTKKAIEIGGASGYSAIWLGLGLRETGGRLTTIEYDPVRAQELKANIAAAAPRRRRHGRRR